LNDALASKSLSQTTLLCLLLTAYSNLPIGNSEENTEDTTNFILPKKMKRNKISIGVLEIGFLSLPPALTRIPRVSISPQNTNV
jgi:hypothetical protein